MTIVITDAKDAIHLTQAEYDRFNLMYSETYRHYYGAVPSLEQFIKSKIEDVKEISNILKNRET